MQNNRRFVLLLPILAMLVFVSCSAEASVPGETALENNPTVSAEGFFLIDVNEITTSVSFFDYNVTKPSLSGSANIENLDVLCGYPRQPGEEKALPFAPVGAPEGSKCSLNPKEYSAVVLASSLSSRHSDFNLGDVTVSQAPAAIEEGRQVAEIAFKAYGGKDVPADKIPLAKLLTLGIRKINQELRLRQGVEKECLKESSARMANMLDRDPELKKLALREGLKENELPVLQKQAPGQEAARENAAGQNAAVQDL